MTHKKDASDAALEFAKHLITLSSGVVAIGATFASQFQAAPRWSAGLLIIAWCALALSVTAGLKTISCIIMSRIHGNDDWSTGNGQRWAKVSRWSFLFGLSAFGLFAGVALLTRKPLLDVGRSQCCPHRSALSDTTGTVCRPDSAVVHETNR